MSLAFPPEIETFVAQEVAAGSYASREALIVAAVELLRHQQREFEQLRTDIAEGMEGVGIPADQVFAELRAKYGPRQSSVTP